MNSHRLLAQILPIMLAVGSASGQTSKFVAGDTLLIPPDTFVDLVEGEDFTTAEAVVAVLVGKRYPYWYIDFRPDNGVVDSAKVGNSFFLGSGVVNRSLEARDMGLEQNRKLSRLGVDVARVGGSLESEIDNLAERGVPLLLKFSFEINDEGGVEPKIRVYNISNQRIRSLDIDFHGFDREGKPVHCTKSGNMDFEVKMNGPINPDAECYFAFVNDPAFFNQATSCLEIDSVTVEFMDGDSIVLDEDLLAIQNLLKSPFMRRGECPS